MLPFEIKVAEFIKKHQLITRGSSILVAVSGGPDSMAILHYLFKRKQYYHINISVAHVDHMLRGNESLEDLQYVIDFCENKGIPYHTTRINIVEKMSILKKGMEETARLFRYKYFEELMKKEKYDKLVLGHHGDDQVETILMRLTRGSTGKGRAGIPLRRNLSEGELIRPLLCLTKKEIEEYCAFYKLNPRQDPSNKKPTYTRNRFRLNVLPFLKKENEHVHEQFQRFSEQIIEDETFLQELTLLKMNKLWNKQKNKVTFNIPSFIEMPLPLQRRGIHLILNYLYNEIPSTLSSIHTEAILRLISSKKPSGRLDFPEDLTVKRSYQECSFSFEEKAQSLSNTYELALFENDTVDLPNGYTLTLKTGEVDDQNIHKDTQCFYLEEDVKLPIRIRNRRPGDRIKVKGLNGTKKVKDIFIDKKIPKEKRDMWPIITDSNNNILWIPNVTKSIYDRSHNPKETSYILQYIKQTSSRGQTCQ